MSSSASPFTGLTLSGFCMQISILLKSAVPLYEGLKVMAEDSPGQQEREILAGMSDKVRMGLPFHQAVKEAGCFPAYVVNMTMLGERTGLLDTTMERLAVYYEKEYYLAENLRKAVTYPAMMILMLIIILFVLFTRVMPIFSGVYEQLGASIPPAAAAAIRLGGFLSGAALVLAAVFIVTALALWIFGKSGKQSAMALSLLEKIKMRSKIAHVAANRRFCSVMSMALQCGVNLPEAFKLAETLVDNQSVEQKVKRCGEAVSQGKGFYDSVKETGLFSGFELQLIRVGSRAGQLDHIMDSLAEDYDKKASEAIDSMIARLEPTIVSVLAVAVGLVLLAVMLPLAGVLSSIG